MSDWVEQWATEEWQTAALGWIQRALDMLGLDSQETARLEPIRTSLSATLYAVPTQAGPLYFKATAPARASEATLTAHLAAVTRGHVPAPVAVEPEQGWILTPAMGTPVADYLPPPRREGQRSAGRLSQPESRELEAMGRWVFAEAGHLHHQTAQNRDRLLGVGAVAYQDAAWPDYLAQALELHSDLPQEHPLWIDDATLSALAAESRHLEDAAAALESTGLPLVLNQANPTSENVLVPDSHRLPVMFVGWSAAAFTNPLLAITSLTAEMSRVFRLEPHEEPVSGLLETYLEPLARHGHAAPGDLIEYLAPAALASHVRDYLALMELLREAHPSTQQEHAHRIHNLLHLAVGLSPNTQHTRRHRVGRRSH